MKVSIASYLLKIIFTSFIKPDKKDTLFLHLFIQYLLSAYLMSQSL